MQIIFHIDLNAFFASAEISKNPSLKGKPIVISGNSMRSVVSTASYEARKFGIHSAMPLFKAKELCKDLIIVEGHHDLYKELSNQFFHLLKTYTYKLEVASIDECYMDMTEVIEQRKIMPQDLAKEIQTRVLEELHLPCSIGIAPNKFMAKMASDIKKPLGITVISRTNYKEILWPLPIEDMYGIGKQTQPKLKEAGITTIKDIANYSNFFKLRTICGNYATIVYQRANGIDQRKVEYKESIAKSVGNSTTFNKNSNDIQFLYSKLKELANEVSSRAKSKKLIGNNITITIKYSDFKSVSRSKVLERYINDYESILSISKQLLDTNYDGRYVRLLGISLNNVILESDYKQQLSIFDTTEENNVNSLLHDLSEKFPDSRFMKASDYHKEEKKEG